MQHKRQQPNRFVPFLCRLILLRNRGWHTLCRVSEQVPVFCLSVFYTAVPSMQSAFDAFAKGNLDIFVKFCMN